jgi:hypothetical protein
MAKKAANAPKIKRLYAEIICPRSMVILLPFNPKKNKTVRKKTWKKKLYDGIFYNDAV